MQILDKLIRAEKSARRTAKREAWQAYFAGWVRSRGILDPDNEPDELVSAKQAFAEWFKEHLLISAEKGK